MSLDLDSEHAASETLKQLDHLTGANIMTLREQWEIKAQQQGMQQGELKKAQETARNLLACGDSLDKVSIGVKELENDGFGDKPLFYFLIAETYQ